MNVSIEEECLGGYFLTRHFARPPYVSSELLPARIISMSDCLAHFVPDVWSLAWASVSQGERIQSATSLGVDPALLQDLITDATSEFDRSWGWPNVIFDLAFAREFAHRFLADVDDLHLIGLALPVDLAPAFIDEARPGPGEGASGLFQCISNGKVPASGGTPVGWEILGFQSSSFHSWLCNGLEREVFRELGLRPAQNGLIDDARKARDIADYCGKEGVGAEPALWQPWLLIEYALR